MSRITKFVVKRDGRKEELALEKISRRLRALAMEEPTLDNIDIMAITLEVVKNITDDITTTKLDDIAAWICSTYSIVEEQYEIMASRIAISNIHKNTPSSFSAMMNILHNESSMINTEIYHHVMLYSDIINAMIDHKRDYAFDYFGIKTLEKMYLLVHNGKIIERPQYMFMRTAIEINKQDLFSMPPRFDRINKVYEQMSEHYYIHATPTLFNACLRKNQLSSCMLLSNEGDSIRGIFDTITKSAILGGQSAGIGIAVSNIRATGSNINSTNRESKGLPMFLTIYDTVASVIDQGGKRKMSIAMYIEPWHADFLDVLDLKANDNLSPVRARNLFYAVWSNELLYKRAMSGQMWSFFCPTKAPKLLTTYGTEFEVWYSEYEHNGLFEKQMPATEVYTHIAKLMIDTGGPYHLNKDACNAKSNMSNVGIINCSNLCAEILIPSGTLSDENEIGVCTLASINLKRLTTSCKYDKEGNMIESGSFDFEQLLAVSRQLCVNLNSIIDNQLYPLRDGELSSLRHRPIGIGVQGLASVFMMLGLPYESEEAQLLNWRISETIYYGAVVESMELAKKYGAYSTFIGSPASKGLLQPHLWQKDGAPKLPYKYDFDALGLEVAKYGLRNALLVAYMPTASTSQLLCNYSSFEPANNNIFSRHTLVGTFAVVNQHLVSVLKTMGLWNKKLKDTIIVANGSVQNITSIPAHIREVYKVVWEMKQKTLMNMAADRGQFICHTQSLNLYIQDPTIKKITSALMYGMKLRLKTISYYTRVNQAKTALKFTVDPEHERDIKADSDCITISDAVRANSNDAVCTKSEGCISCSS